MEEKIVNVFGCGQMTRQQLRDGIEERLFFLCEEAKKRNYKVVYDTIFNRGVIQQFLIAELVEDQNPMVVCEIHAVVKDSWINNGDLICPVCIEDSVKIKNPIMEMHDKTMSIVKDWVSSHDVDKAHENGQLGQEDDCA